MEMKLLVDYITGKRVIRNEQERAAVLMLIDGINYDYSDEQVRELYQRFHNKELNAVQMTYHITLLYTLIINDINSGKDPSTRGKMLLLDFYTDRYYTYLDETLLVEDIERIGTYFEEEVAVC